MTTFCPDLPAEADEHHRLSQAGLLRLVRAAQRELRLPGRGGQTSAAMSELLGVVYPAILAYCRIRLGPDTHRMFTADDVAQETAIALLTALPRYHDQGHSFLGYVYRIAENKVIDTRRRHGRDRSNPVASPPDGPQQGSSPEDHLLTKEFMARLHGLLRYLSDNQRGAVWLRVFEGLSPAEAAERLNTTPGSVRVAAHRALRRLRHLTPPADPLLKAPR
ncbi:RNA polymerase subunit sigma [Amycolatopsis sp. WAC 04197]|uniref:sigma-70 family RNA polymerase sigma factor n=1 Tax=Amycolatopsis sp. WAC 04197 TaxID=2203199 RepID=UPI000F77D429|nr:sigma-70 family RNA polymerase sigma factor [Amycolatopsis sp. WAC 04197]RSN39918.1 RNA polymerase subunit sigma [Amycolatopsis sp. WAC 04197]